MDTQHRALRVAQPGLEQRAETGEAVGQQDLGVVLEHPRRLFAGEPHPPGGHLVPGGGGHGHTHRCGSGLKAVGAVSQRLDSSGGVADDGDRRHEQDCHAVLVGVGPGGQLVALLLDLFHRQRKLRRRTGGVALVLCPLPGELAVLVPDPGGCHSAGGDSHVHDPIPRILEGVQRPQHFAAAGDSPHSRDVGQCGGGVGDEAVAGVRYRDSRGGFAPFSGCPPPG